MSMDLNHVSIDIGSISLGDTSPGAAASSARQFQSSLEARLKAGLQGRDITGLTDVSVDRINIDTDRPDDPEALGAAVAEALLKEILG